MQIKLLVSRAGVGFSQVAGQVLTVPLVDGMKAVAAGQAELVSLSPEEQEEGKKKLEMEPKKTKAAEGKP